MLTTICITLGSAATAARDQAPVFPKMMEVINREAEESEPNKVTLRRNGTGLCEWGLFQIDLYEAALYLQNPSNKAREVIESNQVKRLELRFLRDLSRKQMRRAYSAAFRANTEDESEPYQERIDRFVRLIPGVKKGNRLAFTCFPGRGLEIRLGKTLLDTIPGDDFGRLFMQLYVGPIPPTQAVRKGLLGLSGED